MAAKDSKTRVAAKRRENLDKFNDQWVRAGVKRGIIFFGDYIVNLPV